MTSAFFPSAKGQDLKNVGGCRSEERKSYENNDLGCITSPQKIRFPSSRRSLWDRTPFSSNIHLTSKECLPAIKLHKANEWKKVHACGLSSWDLACTTTGANSPEFIFGTGHGAIKGALLLEPRGAALPAGADPVADLARSATSDYNDTCPLSQVVRLRASVGASGGQVTVKAAAPSATVSLSPLPPKRVCSTPLAVSLLQGLQQARRESLTDQSFPCASMQRGVLTLDQGRSLVPLQAAEAQAEGVPVVGLWMSGVRSVRDPHVWAACMRFLLSAQLQDKAIQPDLAFLVLVYAPGEGRYPACYEAKVGLDGAQLPVATFSVRARPALKTGCASFSLDLAAAGMASLPIHTGCPSKASSTRKGGRVFPVSAGAPEKLLQRTRGDACEHSSDESDVPRPRSPLREQPHSAERCRRRFPGQAAADARCMIGGSSPAAVAGKATPESVAHPPEQFFTEQQSMAAGQTLPGQPCQPYVASAPAPLPEAVHRKTHAADECNEHSTQTHPSNPLFRQGFGEPHDRASAAFPEEEEDTAEPVLPMEDRVSRQPERGASESDIEGPATPAYDVHNATVAAPQQPLSSPDAAMLQRQVDLLKEQLEALRVQLQAQGSAVPAHAAPGKTVQLLQSLLNIPVTPPGEGGCTDGMVPSNFNADQPLDAVHAHILPGRTESCNGARNTSSSVSTPLSCSRQSSFSADSISDSAAAAAIFAAYATPLAADAAPVVALPLILDTAASDPLSENGVVITAGKQHSITDHLEAGSMPCSHSAEAGPAPVQHATGAAALSGNSLENSVLKETAAEHHAGPQEQRPSGYAILSAGEWSGSVSAASLDSDSDEDPASFAVGSAVAISPHAAGAELVEISNPYRTLPYTHQHAVIQAVDPSMDFFSDSEDEAEMARLEKKYNIIPRLPDRGKPTAWGVPALEGILHVPRGSSWPSGDAACHISLNYHSDRL